jgi:hypothetical protein
MVEAVADKYFSGRTVETRKEKFATLNTFVSDRQGWITSLPGAPEITIECLRRPMCFTAEHHIRTPRPRDRSLRTISPRGALVGKNLDVIDVADLLTGVDR